MLELFFKHLDFIQFDGNREMQDDKFIDPVTQKHWRSFQATYRKGYIDACNKIGVLAVQEIGA